MQSIFIASKQKSEKGDTMLWWLQSLVHNKLYILVKFYTCNCSKFVLLFCKSWCAKYIHKNFPFIPKINFNVYLVLLLRFQNIVLNVLECFSGIIDDKPLRFRGEVYHPYHFNCTACGVELNSDAREVKSRPGFTANDMVPTLTYLP